MRINSRPLVLLTNGREFFLFSKGGIYMNFNHQQIEKKWQAYWEENKTFKTGEDEKKPKFYALDMFPYPFRSRATCGASRRLYSD